tara:strand:- start:115 stop:1743 length:1629 start_codon:yes stop_codon:yes gene_type:complete
MLVARGFLPSVDTSGISQGISDAASGLGGWLSNAFTTPDSVVQSEAQRLGYIDAADRELTNDLVQHKFKYDMLRPALGFLSNVSKWGGNPLQNLEQHDPNISARLQSDENEDYEAAVHAAALTHPRGWVRGLKNLHKLIDTDSAKEQAQEAWSDNRIMELSQGGRVSIPELVRQGIGQYPASVASGVDLNEEPSSPITRFWDRATDKGSDLIDWFTPSLPDLSGVNLPVEEPTGSLFGDPSISNENTLMMNSLIPVSTGGGMGGMIEDGVQTDFEPIEVMPEVDIESLLSDDHVDRMPVLYPLGKLGEEESTFPGTIEDLLGDRLDYNAPFNQALNIRPETTPEEFDDFVTSQVLGVDMPEIVSSLPSGPEEMTEVFTEEDKAAEDERKRIADIEAQAERDRFELERKAERLAWEARREQERAEKEARDKREEAAKAQDRQDKARLSREADERERQAQERQREIEAERQQAVEAARLNALAAAAEQQNLANQRRQREEEAKQKKESDRLHRLNMDMLERMRNERLMERLNRGSSPGQYLYDI